MRRFSAAVDPPRPTLRVALPFIAVATVGVASVLLPPYSARGVEPLAMGLLFAVTLGFVLVSINRPTRTWVDPIAPWLFFAVIVVGRDATGGSASELAPMVALPVLWLAIVGTFSDLMVAVALTAATFFVPLVVIGEPDYIMADWRRGLIWTSIALFIAPVIQRIVRQLSVETFKEKSVRSELDGIMRGARLSSIISCEIDGTIASFGPGAEELLGYSADEMVGLQTPGVFHDPEEVASVAEELGVDPGFGVFTELARLNSPSRIWTYIRSDGRRIFVRLAVTERRDLDGQLTGYLGVAIDTTQSVESERSLAVAEAQLRSLLDHLPDTLVTIVDHQQRIQLVAGQSSMRETMDSNVGRRLEEVSNETNMQLWRPMLAKAFAGEESTADVSAAETGIDFEVVVSPLPSDDLGPRALIIGRDVSRERAREREVVRARDRADRLFSDAPHGVAVLTTEGIVLRANDAMHALVSDTEKTMVSRSLDSFSKPGDDRFRRHLVDVLDGRSAEAATEWTMRSTDDDDVHVVLTSRLLHEDPTVDDIILVNVVDVSERHRYEQRLAHLADHDALTGLANRRRFDEELTRHLDRCERNGPIGAVLLMDLDNFKEVNDTLGHPAGDELIVSTAALLRRGMRRTDVVARLGGDEFAILLPEADREGAEAAAKSIVERIRAHAATLDGTRRRVTASIGVVALDASVGQSVDVLALADMTMYDAKDAGRDGYVVLSNDDGGQPRSGARLQWKGRIEAAIENDDFVLYLQPILDLSTGKIGSAEALLRLHDRDEVISPSRFLYIAERTGLAPSLDTWVLKHSIAMLAQLREMVPDFQLEVNLSGHSIDNPAIEGVVVDTLAAQGVDPSALILEVTETSAVADVQVAREFAERMSALGCKFALDDFGAGFGSFYYLKHLLFDYVKIDGEFVANCHRSSTDRTILRSIVGIAHDLGKRTVAEFVAEQAILDVVREEGVDLAQRYLIGKPMPFDDFVHHVFGADGGLK